jgi:hypothetical protein
VSAQPNLTQSNASPNPGRCSVERCVSVARRDASADRNHNIKPKYLAQHRQIHKVISLRLAIAKRSSAALRYRALRVIQTDFQINRKPARFLLGLLIPLN